MSQDYRARLIMVDAAERDRQMLIRAQTRVADRIAAEIFDAGPAHQHEVWHETIEWLKIGGGWIALIALVLAVEWFGR